MTSSALDRPVTCQHRQDSPQGVRPLCVCYVLSYRARDYIRTRSLCAALNMMPRVTAVLAVNEHGDLRRYFETWRALMRVRAASHPDVYILGFRGYEVFPWVRWMTRGKPLVFDAFMSPTAALRNERKAGRIGVLLAPLLRPAERFALVRSQLVLTDTKLLADYFADAFHLDTAKFLDLPVGAVEAASAPTVPVATSGGAVFSVLFYGSFLPLHGVEVIVSAAALLRDLPIRFDFVGGGVDATRRIDRQCASHGVARYTHRPWMPFDSLLRDAIPAATVCLAGPFGGTPQARRVVTGKASQALALGRPTVIGKIDEDFGFRDRVNCLLVDQQAPAALAQALRWAYGHRPELARIGELGRRLYASRLSVRVIADRLEGALQALVARPQP